MSGKDYSTQTGPSSNSKTRRRSPSPSQRPNTSTEEENVYVLTFQTDGEHQQRMTALRNKYFPPKLNKLGAHLTLFHALPESKLETSIIPAIKTVAGRSPMFEVRAHKPFRLSKGIALSCTEVDGADKLRGIRTALQRTWLEEGFLSHQDSGKSSRMHYTLMNKVDDAEEIDRAFQELQAHFTEDRGMVQGLDLYRYDRGWWKHYKTFQFRAPENKT